MPGMFGDDFDVTQPEDSSAVKHGASWIRDTKARIKRFLAVMFNLETGRLKNDVVDSSMLKDLTTAGTFTEVTVNAKGLVTSGSNPVEQKAARIFRAIFTTTNVIYETDDGLSDAATPDLTGTYMGSGTPYKGTYASLNGAGWNQYNFSIPTDVRRMKAIIVGGGGGKDDSGSTNGGAGGELVETIFDVDGQSTITVIVGDGGAGGSGGDGQAGGASSVYLSDTIYAEAGGGAAGTSGAGGSAVTGSKATSVLNILAVSGEDGAADDGGETGSYYKKYGRGAPDEVADVNGDDGVVILEWML